MHYPFPSAPAVKRIIFILLIGIALRLPGHTATHPSLWYASSLPVPAQLFLKKHFSTLSVDQVTIECLLIGRQYHVRLAGGGQIQFDHHGNWTRINCQRYAIPESAIPCKILQYVKQHYPDHFISLIAREESGYATQIHDLALERDIALRFNRRYEYIVDTKTP